LEKHIVQGPKGKGNEGEASPEVLGKKGERGSGKVIKGAPEAESLRWGGGRE